MQEMEKRKEADERREAHREADRKEREEREAGENKSGQEFIKPWKTAGEFRVILYHKQYIGHRILRIIFLLIDSKEKRRTES